MNCPSCGCSVVEVTNIPGTPGADGPAGAGGQNAYTVLTSALTIPAALGTATALVASSLWMVIGQNIVMGDGTNFGNFRVVSFPSSAAAVVEFLAYPGDSAPGAVIAIGATVSPSGLLADLTSLTAFTDNTTGAATNTLAAGAGVQTIALFVNLVDLSAADSLTTYTLGYKFKLLSVSFAVEKAATTAGKAATLTTSISGVAVTGGVLALTSANCTPKGVVVAGTAVTATNTGSAAATISITGSAVTPFIEGAGWILITVQNLDTADAFASLAAKVNAIIAI